MQHDRNDFMHADLKGYGCRKSWQRMNLRPMKEIDLFSLMYCVQTIPLHCVSVLNLWIPFDMVVMWMEALLSVGAQLV